MDISNFSCLFQHYILKLGSGKKMLICPTHFLYYFICLKFPGKGKGVSRSVIMSLWDYYEFSTLHIEIQCLSWGEFTVSLVTIYTWMKLKPACIQGSTLKSILESHISLKYLKLFENFILIKLICELYTPNDRISL